MKKILFPTDFSENSLKAFRYALQVANQFNASITTIHAYLAPVTVAAPAVMVQEFVEAIEETEQKNFTVFNRKTYDIALAENLTHIHIHHQMEYGLAVEEILKLSKEEDFDLIVMSTDGADGLGRWIFGSHAASVASRASCPVLVVPKDAEYKPITKIAYATDFENIANDIENDIMDWVTKFNTELHFIHIAHSGEYIDIDQYHNMEEITEMTQKFDNVKFKIIYDRSVLDELEEYTEENEIDILIMVKRQWPFYKRVFQPSLTKQMTFETDVPLLVFHK